MAVITVYHRIPQVKLGVSFLSCWEAIYGFVEYFV